MTTNIVVRLVVAALCGLAVGVEREWSGHAAGPHGRFAGMRTFLLLGLLGGIVGCLTLEGYAPLAVALAAGGMALIVAAYVAAARRGGDAIEGTTEVAALAVVALGIMAGFGYLAIAGGAVAVIVLVLAEKERLHGLVAHIGTDEMHAAFQFAVLALVVLPALPDQSYGPLGGIRPRTLWIVVLIFSGINFVAYVARKEVGTQRGYGIAGMLGGAISSTAVAFQFSRRSGEEQTAASGLALGVVGACVVLLPRLLVLSTVLNPAVALALLPLLGPPFAAGVLLVVWALWHRWGHEGAAEAPNEIASPLRLWSAVKMALAFQISLMLLSYVRQQLGTTGVYASAAVLGLTDMDALAVSMNRLGGTADMVAIAARAIALGIVANSVLKLVLILVLGRGHYRRLAATGLGLLTLLSLGTLVALW